MGRGRLALSGILVHGFKASGQSAPNPLESPAARVFKLGGRLEWEVTILNAQVDGVTLRPDVLLQVRLLRDGQEEYAGKLLPVDSSKQTDVKRLWAGGSLLLGSKMAAGDYELELLAVDQHAKQKYRNAKQSIGFSVSP